MLRLRPEQVRALQREAAFRLREITAQDLSTSTVGVVREGDDDLRVTEYGDRETVLSFRPGELARRSEEGRENRLLFDHWGLIQRTIQPSGLVCTFERDQRGRLQMLHRGAVGATRFGYDGQGRVSSITLPDGHEHHFSFDADDRMLEHRFPNGTTTRYEHTNKELRFVDALGRITTYSFDGRYRLRGVVWPDGQEDFLDRGEDGQSLSLVRAGVPWVDLRVSPDGDTSRVDYHDGLELSFVHEKGELVRATGGGHEVFIEYDGKGRLAKEHADGVAVESSYDRSNRRVALSVAQSAPLRFRYDGDDRVVSVVDWSGAEIRFDYAPNDGGLTARFPNGVESFATVDTLGRAKELGARGPRGALFSQRLSYDALDRRVALENDNSSTTFGYDSLGRLASVRNGSEDERYPLDAQGNRQVYGDEQASYDARDQLVAIGEKSLRYDLGGRLVEQQGKAHEQRRLEFDGAGRLKTIHCGPHTIRYEYDALGRRVLRQTSDYRDRFLWDGLTLIAEDRLYDDGRRVWREYLYAPGTHLLLAIREDDAIYYAHCDHRGAPLILTDARGEVAWRAKYDAWGRTTIVTEKVRQPMRLPGMVADDESGLYYNLARYYDPELGRYLSPDPVGRAGGSANLYLYADGDPLNRCDPSGTFLNFIIGAGIGAAINAAIYAATTDDFSWSELGKEAAQGAVLGAGGPLLAGAGRALVMGSKAGKAAVAAAQAATKGKKAAAAVASTTAVAGGEYGLGVTMSCADQAMDGGPIDMDRAHNEGIISAVTGGVAAAAAPSISRFVSKKWDDLTEPIRKRWGKEARAERARLKDIAARQAKDRAEIEAQKKAYVIPPPAQEGDLIEIPIEEIRSRQGFVDWGGPHKPYDPDAYAPEVYWVDWVDDPNGKRGFWALGEGNHRTADQIFRGEKTIKARVTVLPEKTAMSAMRASNPYTPYLEGTSVWGYRNGQDVNLGKVADFEGIFSGGKSYRDVDIFSHPSANPAVGMSLD